MKKMLFYSLLLLCAATIPAHEPKIKTEFCKCNPCNCNPCTCGTQCKCCKSDKACQDCSCECTQGKECSCASSDKACCIKNA